MWHQLISRLRFRLEFTALFQHNTPDMIVQKGSNQWESFSEPEQFACSQFCMTLERGEMSGGGLS